MKDIQNRYKIPKFCNLLSKYSGRMESVCCHYLGNFLF